MHPGDAGSDTRGGGLLGGWARGSAGAGGDREPPVELAADLVLEVIDVALEVAAHGADLAVELLSSSSPKAPSMSATAPTTITANSASIAAMAARVCRR